MNKQKFWHKIKQGNIQKKKVVPNSNGSSRSKGMESLTLFGGIWIQPNSWG